jgi:uracil-DNA glycosylase
MGFWYEQDLETQNKELARVQRTRERKVIKVNELLALAKQGCSACPLDKAVLVHPKMPPTGTNKPVVYILGEAPGAQEDEEGEQFIGKAGQTLRAEIPGRYINQIRWNNCIRCRPPGNRDPEPLELECCRNLQVQDIERTKPKAILGFGAVPLNWAIPKGVIITPWRGRRMPVQIGSHICWYYPIMHPSYINRIRDAKGKGEEQWRTFRKDVKRALAEVFEDGLPAPYVETKEHYMHGVQIMLKPTLAQLEHALEEALSWAEFGLDYETNAFRPYFPERRLLTIAISNYEHTLAFPYQHPELDWGKQLPKVRALVRNFLLNSKCKWAHNLGFEQEWTAEEFGEDLLRGTEWGDTIAQAYVLDEREGAKELGDLTLLHLGFDVKAKSSVDTAHLALEPLRKVLPYNALDAKYCFALSLLQRDLLQEQHLESVYQEQIRRTPTLVLTQRVGLVPNATAIAELLKKHSTVEKETTKRILAHKDVKAWLKAGNKLLVSSPKDWKQFLQSKFKKIDNAQEETLAALHYEPADLEVQRRHAHKLISTYLVPYNPPEGSAVHADGRIHTLYNANKTTTRRLSSVHPNVQNVEVRTDPDMRKIIKSPT